MRVKISYTMDINDVPDKVGEIIQKSLNELQEAKELLQRALSDLDKPMENMSHSIAAVDRARLAMGSVDASLIEAQSIMSALESYYKGEDDVPNRRPAMDTRGSNVAQTENPQ
jgi:hypothetical protein